MIPVKFDYAAPESLDAAVKLLQENETAQILAGGHSLMIAMKQGSVTPSLLVDLRKIPGLQGIHSTASGGIQIGAMTTYADITTAGNVRTDYLALAEAAGGIGDAQIRNWTPIGDIFAYHDLACDLPAVALALQAIFQTIQGNGTRSLSAEDFVQAYFNNRLPAGEIVTAVEFPARDRATGSAYEHLCHPASGHTVCGVAAFVSVAADGTLAECRIAIAGATAYPVRLHAVETALQNQAPTPENIAQATAQAVDTTNAIAGVPLVSGPFASAEYRAHLISVLTERAIARAIQQTS